MFQNSTYNKQKSNSFVIFRIFFQYLTSKFSTKTQKLHLPTAMDSKCHQIGPNCKMRMQARFDNPNVRTQNEKENSNDIHSVQQLTMEGKKFLTSDPAWQKLQDYYNQTGKNLVIKDLFKNDANRFNKYRSVFM